MKYLNNVWHWCHSNWAKHIFACLLLIACMGGLLWLNADVYRTFMMFLGGWQCGTWVGNWCRARWPLTQPEAKPREPEDITR